MQSSGYVVSVAPRREFARDLSCSTFAQFIQTSCKPAESTLYFWNMYRNWAALLLSFDQYARLLTGLVLSADISARLAAVDS